MDRGACALGCTTRAGDPYPAPEGYRLCDRCITRTRDTITEIRERWQKIVPTWALLRERRGEVIRTPGFASSAPGDVHVMALRDARTVAREPGDVRSPLEVLHAWASRVRVWRSVRPPTTATVDSEAATLLFHFDWIAREFAPEWLVTFSGELAEVRGQLRTVTGERAPAVVGHCSEMLEDGQVCGGALWLLGDDVRVLRCPRCSATSDVDDLISGYRAMRESRYEDAESGVSVPASVAAMMVREAGIPCTPDLLPKWVQRGHIRRTGPRGYDVVSIMDYVTRRLVNPS